MSRGSRLARLDGLRGLAVAVVVATHMHRWPLLVGGEVAIEVFFALSGFLITLVLLEDQTPGKLASLGRFYLRRALRLLPGLWFFLAMWLAVVVVFHHDHWTASVPGVGLQGKVCQALRPAAQGVAVALVYMTNWWMAYGLFSGYVALGHLWSLAIEEQFYLIWAPVVVAMRAARLRGALVALSVVAATASLGESVAVFRGGAGLGRVYLGTDTRAAALLLGAAAGALWTSGYLQRELGGRLGGVALRVGAALVVLAGLGMDHGGHRVLWLTGWLMAAPGSALIVASLAARAEGRAARLLSAPWLVYLGRRSYGIYLWHYVWATWLASFGALRIPLVVISSLACAEISWIMIERPALRVKDGLAPLPRSRCEPLRGSCDTSLTCLRRPGGSHRG